MVLNGLLTVRQCDTNRCSQIGKTAYLSTERCTTGFQPIPYSRYGCYDPRTMSHAVAPLHSRFCVCRRRHEQAI
jgi:hypothetical protein